MSRTPLQLASQEGARKSNLAFALAGLPRDRRSDAMIFYSFCRAVDDIADDPLRSPGEKREILAHWKDALEKNENLPPPLVEIIQRRNLDRGLLREIVLGMEMDVEPARYATYDDLRAYCWRVACAVGLVSIEIFGCRHAASKIFAEHLGHALQLTNILRDVGEDAAMGRIYLPLEDLRRFGVSESSLLAQKPDGDFSGLMKFEAARAKEQFASAKNILPAGDAAALAPARAMQAIYEKILKRMTADGFNVFAKRYRVPAWEKTILLGKTLLPRAVRSAHD